MFELKSIEIRPGHFAKRYVNANGSIVYKDDFGHYKINCKNGMFEVSNDLEKAFRIAEKLEKF